MSAPLLAVVGALLALLGARTWTPAPVRDQGARPWCTVYAVEGSLGSGPHPQPWQAPGPLFAAAQALNHDTGSGTTMGAVLAVLQREGRAGPFAITREPGLAQLWVLLVGPIILEGRWADDMERADAAGAWHLSGVAWARHAFFCYAIRADGTLRCQNSHGGVGRGTLSPADLARYLAADGYVALLWPTRPGAVVYNTGATPRAHVAAKEIPMGSYYVTYSFTNGTLAKLQADTDIPDSLITGVSLALKGPDTLGAPTTASSDSRVKGSYSEVPDCVNWNGVVGISVSSDGGGSLTADLKVPSGSASQPGTAPGPVSVSVPV